MYEEIKAEIERRMKDNVAAEERWKTGYYGMAVKEDYELLSFIESLPKPSEDLEKAAKEYGRDLIPLDQCDTRDIVNAFKAGAQWQKEQMIPVTALVNESKDFLSLSLSTEEYAKIGRRFKGGDDIEIYIKQDKK